MNIQSYCHFVWTDELGFEKIDRKILLTTIFEWLCSWLQHDNIVYSICIWRSILVYTNCCHCVGMPQLCEKGESKTKTITLINLHHGNFSSQTNSGMCALPVVVKSKNASFSIQFFHTKLLTITHTHHIVVILHFKHIFHLQFFRFVIRLRVK